MTPPRKSKHPRKPDDLDPTEGPPLDLDDDPTDDDPPLEPAKIPFIPEPSPVPATPEPAAPPATPPAEPEPIPMRKIERERETARSKASPTDPLETYNYWREKLWREGLTELRIQIRDLEGPTYADRSEGPLLEMPPYFDLLKMLKYGVFRLQLVTQDKYGRPTPLTPFLTLNVAPPGETEVVGMSNPYSLRGKDPQQGQAMQLKDILSWQQAEADKRDKLQQTLLQQQQTSTNGWIQALFSQPKGGSDLAAMMPIIMQQQQQSNAQMIAMITTTMQSFSALMTAIMGNQGNQTQPLLEVLKAQNEQWKTLFQSQTQTGTLKEQLEVYKTISEITQGNNNTSTIRDLADLAGAIKLGDNLETLTGSLARRIEAPKTPATTEATAEPPKPIEPLPPPPGATTTTIQPAQPRTPAPIATAKPQQPVGVAPFFQLMDFVNEAYKQGKEPDEVFELLAEKNPTILQLLLNSGHTIPEIVAATEQFAPEAGCPQLATTGGKRFVLSFLERVFKEGTSDATA